MIAAAIEAGGGAPVGRGRELSIVLLLGFAYGFAFYDRQMMTFVTPFVIPDLRLSNLQVGALGAGLSLTWAIGAYAFGRWSDALGVRKPFLLAALVIFSLCSVLSGLAPGFWPLLASRMLMGAVEGPFLPICLSIVATASPPMRRGLNAGIVQNLFGSLLGAAVAPLAAVAIAQSLGWRAAFTTAALPGLILAILIWRFLREPPRPRVAAGQTAIGLAAMLRQRNILLCAAISCLLVGSAVLCSIFLPVYFVSVRHWSPARMAGVMALLGLCPPAGGVIVPFLSDRIGRKPPLILSAALMVLTPLAALLVAGPDWLLVALLLVGWIGMGSFPLFMAVVPAETLAFRSTATAMGLVVAIGELTGGVAGPLVAGRIADGFGLAAPLLISAGMAALAAVVALGLIETNPRRRVVARRPYPETMPMARTPQEQANLDFCTRMYHEMLFRFDAARIDEFIAPDYVQHSTAASEGREGLRAFFLDRGDRFPDVRMRIAASFADGDFTIFHIHTIRHAGDPGLAIVDIFRLAGGLVREHWEVVQEIPASLPHANGIF